MFMSFFFFKQKTAYEMRISDWSSDVCSSDLLVSPQSNEARTGHGPAPRPPAFGTKRRPPRAHSRDRDRARSRHAVYRRYDPRADPPLPQAALHLVDGSG